MGLAGKSQIWGDLNGALTAEFDELPEGFEDYV
jgi:hypothetical protein